MQSKFTKWVLIFFLILGSITWILLFRFFYNNFMSDLMLPMTGVKDVSRRLESPNRQKVGLLVRDSGFELNFQLYIYDDYFIQPPYDPNASLWLSDAYNPDDKSVNLHEDLEWSKDSSVIVVIIDGEYVFAYDFDSQREYEDAGEIKPLLESRNMP